MIRALLPSILLFLLPFALYGLWLAIRRRAGPEPARRISLIWMAVAGSILAVAGFIFFTDFRAAPPDAIYVPPRYQDGKLVPGHFAPPAKTP